MKINVLTEILDLNEKPIPDGNGNLTLRTVLARALTELAAGDKPEGATSVRRLNLALEIMNKDEVDPGVEETKTLMELVGRMYTPLVAGRVWHILDPTMNPASYRKEK